MDSAGFDWRQCDYYMLLGVARNADREGLHRGFRQMAKVCHPDRFPIDSPERAEAHEQFKTLTLAYDVLSDPDRRSAYDKQLARSEQKTKAKPVNIDELRYQAAQAPEPPPPAPEPPKAGSRVWQESGGLGGHRGSGWFAAGEADSEVEAPAPPPTFMDAMREAMSRRSDRPSDDDASHARAMKQSGARAYYEQGMRYFNYGDYRAAYHAFTQAQRLDPSRKIPPTVWAKIQQSWRER